MIMEPLKTIHRSSKERGALISDAPPFCFLVMIRISFIVYEILKKSDNRAIK